MSAGPGQSPPRGETPRSARRLPRLRLLGKPRRGWHHEVRGARGGGRGHCAAGAATLSLSLPRTPPSLSRPGASPRSPVLSPPPPFVPSHFFLSCNPPSPLIGGRGGRSLSTFSRFFLKCSSCVQDFLPKFNVLPGSLPQPLRDKPGRWGGVRESGSACCWETGIFPSPM